MNWNTRFTDLVGCKYPIVQGAYGGFGTSAIAAPVSAAGGLGVITAGALKDPESLRQDIRRTREMTDKPFGVNITMVRNILEMAPRFLDVIIEEKVPVLFTAAYKADLLGKQAQKAGLVWIHKVATVKHALAAQDQGADAVVLVGLEGAGFKSAIQLPTLIGLTTIAKNMHVPLLAAGGIGDARGVLAALAMGAEGVYLGTRFMATQECPIAERSKQRMVDSDPEDPKVRDRALAPPREEAMARVRAERGSKELGQWLSELERTMVSGSGGDTEERTDPSELIGAGAPSLAVGVIDTVPTCKELIEGIFGEAEQLLKSSGPLARIING